MMSALARRWADAFPSTLQRENPWRMASTTLAGAGTAEQGDKAGFVGMLSALYGLVVCNLQNPLSPILN